MPSVEGRAYAIEINGKSAGIVIADRDGFTFFAADRDFRNLDRRVFRRIDQAERAVRRLDAQLSRPN
jgi:hypothetical protein